MLVLAVCLQYHVKFLSRHVFMMWSTNFAGSLNLIIRIVIIVIVIVIVIIINHNNNNNNNNNTNNNNIHISICRRTVTSEAVRTVT